MLPLPRKFIPCIFHNSISFFLYQSYFFTELQGHDSRAAGHLLSRELKEGTRNIFFQEKLVHVVQMHLEMVGMPYSSQAVVAAHTGHQGMAAMETQIMLMSVSGMVTHLKHMYLQSKRFFVFAFFILLGLGSPNYVELEHDCLEISVP